MVFTRAQKKFIKNKIKWLSVSEIASQLGVDEKDINEFLMNRWGKEKYEEYLKKTHDSPVQSLPSLPPEGKTQNGIVQPAKKNLKIYIFSSLFFLALLVIIAYVNSLNNGFVSDDHGILENRFTKDLSNIYTHPLAFVQPTIYYVAYKLGGFNPFFYRLINVLFHMGAVWMLYLLLILLTTPLTALFAASLLAVHPIEIEAVAWVAGGTYSQYTFFFLASFILYILFKKSSRYKLLLYFGAVFLYFSANAVSVMAPVLWIVLMFYELAYGNLKKNWPYLIPFFLINCFYIFRLSGSVAPRLQTFKTGYYQDNSYYNPFTQIPIAISNYLELLFWPDKLTLYHTELLFTPINFAIRVGVTIVYFGSLIYLFFKNKKIFFWLSLYVVAILPTLSPFRIAWIVAERYVYLGTIGIFVLFAMLMEWLATRRNLKIVVYSAMAIILIALTTRTIVRNIDWSDEDHLWIATARTSPTSFVNHNNLGDMYARHGQFEKSIVEFEKALSLNPNYADAYNNLGNTFGRMGRMNDAIASYQYALKLNPGIWQSYENIGVIYFGQKKYALAEENTRKAVELYPENTSLHLNLAIILYTENRKQEARVEFQKVLTLDPTNKIALEGLKRTQ